MASAIFGKKKKKAESSDPKTGPVVKQLSKLAADSPLRKRWAMATARMSTILGSGDTLGGS